VELALASALLSATSSAPSDLRTDAPSLTTNGILGTPAALFQSLRVERTSDGGVRIDAPPEAAESLIALFDGMAKLLSSIGGSAT